VSMIILLEIPGAALLAALFLGETLPAGTYAGLGLILAGLAVVVLGQKPGRAGRRPAARGQEPPSDRLAELGTD
jgi:drug/metabolite transporter (DMT)-like permease